jgi:type IV secretory pathway VirB2 component (pilin)
MSTDIPKGEKREVTGLGAVAIGGTPVAYVAIMAAIVVAFAFVPASIVIGGAGQGWPAHDILHPLIGLLLGPIAGPIASIIGIFIGNALAPYTNLGPWAMLLGAMSSFSVGMVTQRGKMYWLIPWLITLVLHVVFFFQASAQGVGVALWFSNTFPITIALILMIIPQVREWAVNAVQSENMTWKTGVALYILFLFGSAAGIQAPWVVWFAQSPWPAEAWPGIVPAVILERGLFPLIGALIGMGVIAALRRSSFVKPKLAGY